jgi:hypothetical protein
LSIRHCSNQSVPSTLDQTGERGGKTVTLFSAGHICFSFSSAVPGSACLARLFVPLERRRHLRGLILLLRVQSRIYVEFVFFASCAARAGRARPQSAVPFSDFRCRSRSLIPSQERRVRAPSSADSFPRQERPRARAGSRPNFSLRFAAATRTFFGLAACCFCFRRRSVSAAFVSSHSFLAGLLLATTWPVIPSPDFCLANSIMSPREQARPVPVRTRPGSSCEARWTR